MENTNNRANLGVLNILFFLNYIQKEILGWKYRFWFWEDLFAWFLLLWTEIQLNVYLKFTSLLLHLSKEMFLAQAVGVCDSFSQNAYITHY